MTPGEARPDDSARASAPVHSLLTLQQLVAAAERLAARHAGGAAEVDWLGLVEDAYDLQARRPLHVHAMNGWQIERGHKRRLITAPVPVEHLVEEAFVPVLERLLDPQLGDGVHGYRRGRSTRTAALEAVQGLAESRRFVLKADVADFFPSVPWDRLREVLTQLLPAPHLELALAFVQAPLRVRGRVERRDRGLPLGRPVSPILSNAFLRGVDAAMESTGGTYLRYADDILSLSATPEGRTEALEILKDGLSRLGLELNASKTQCFEYDGRPLSYLGHLVDERGVYSTTPTSPPPPKPARDAGHVGGGGAARGPEQRTLYVTEPGLHLRTRSGALEVCRGKETVRTIPVDRLDRVLLLAGVSLTSGFATTCIEHDIPVIFVVGKGHAFGALRSSHTLSPLRRRAQYDLHSDASRRLHLARGVVSGKIEAMLRQARRRKVEESLLAGLLRARADVESADQQALFGVEGTATRLWYGAWRTWVKREGFAFERRTRHPPRDPVNSLLSFAYTLLFAEMETTLLGHGLDPYPSLLHSLRRNHPALASDLSEPYRVRIADAFVLKLVNRKQVKAEGFVKRAGGAVYMDAKTRRVFLHAWEAHQRRPFGGKGRGATPRDLVTGAVRAMLGVVMGETDDLRLPLSSADLAAPVGRVVHGDEGPSELAAGDGDGGDTASRAEGEDEDLPHGHGL